MKAENLINEQLDISKIKEEYQKDNFVIVRNFLKEEWADKLSKYYENIPADWWSWMFLPDPDLGINSWGTSIYREDGSAALKQLISKKRQFLETVYKENRGFSYIYKRVFFESHFATCLCEECVFRKSFLEVSPMLNFLQEVTGHNELKPGELFTSKYGHGDYNGPHNDNAKGRATIVLNLSKGWLPQDGGIFFGMEEDFVSVKHVEVPTFNSLVIFDVSEGGMPHLVNHVTNPSKTRLAVTGWYT
jgi:Rps23 Pro-64 3,4-dihydroxylase Tpa1-like proline 4-hydroxylase